MKSFTYACIAYIVGRLIAGKKIKSIYDYTDLKEIDSLPDAEQLKDLSYANWSYISSTPSISRFQYSFKTGDSADLSKTVESAIEKN